MIDWRETLKKVFSYTAGSPPYGGAGARPLSPTGNWNGLRVACKMPASAAYQEISAQMIPNHPPMARSAVFAFANSPIVRKR